MVDTALAAQVSELLRELVLLLRRSSADMSVSAPQLAVLATLRDGPLRMSQLAHQHGVRLPTMTSQVDRLERDGLVTRQRRDRDGRVVSVELTGTGRAELERGVERRVAFLAERLSGLSAADQSAIAAAVPALKRLAGPTA
ncbi:DNA-binding MarR family transcriptional regulator [Stackebrandtia endophytica]|uniref:DNA-binding MarR family transcriptional regulator n=1 Tax=Stackebrandtia endophytica TaxID=1496996 RepID=A0A543AUB3_9ACTN|nr:MarR family transcriptional regulator [Stackebrandtia endophytica]TQL76162.1 DNA-binding MarR family transcriptional regulator [Stackebrandtia endophytica]